MCPTKDILDKTVEYFGIKTSPNWNSHKERTYLVNYNGWCCGDISMLYYREDIAVSVTLFQDIFNEDFLI